MLHIIQFGNWYFTLNQNDNKPQFWNYKLNCNLDFMKHSQKSIMDQWNKDVHFSSHNMILIVAMAPAFAKWNENCLNNFWKRGTQRKHPVHNIDESFLNEQFNMILLFSTLFPKMLEMFTFVLLLCGKWQWACVILSVTPCVWLCLNHLHLLIKYNRNNSRPRKREKENRK